MPARLRGSVRRWALAGILTPGLAIHGIGIAAADDGNARGIAAGGVGASVADTTTPRPALFRIDLKPTRIGSGATGVAKLALAPSPFGISLTPDGHFRFDVELTVSGLPEPSAWGPYSTYVAWATTQNLDVARRLGVVAAGKPIKTEVDYHKFILLITAEANSGGEHWSGPVVLRGLSASMFLDNFSGKTFFNNGVPQ